jgi:hypothetical protein
VVLPVAADPAAEAAAFPVVPLAAADPAAAAAASRASAEAAADPVGAAVASATSAAATDPARHLEFATLDHQGLLLSRWGHVYPAPSAEQYFVPADPA